MDWNDISGLIGKAAPLLGTLLGGAAGAAVGGMISAALGCDNAPDAIHQAVQDNPDAAVKLAQIEADNQTKLQELIVTAEANRLAAETAQMQAVNGTMQMESKSDDLWQRRWRPFIGFVTGATFAVVCVFVMALLAMAIFYKQPDAMAAITNVVNAMVLLFGVPGAILGVSAWHRGVEKVELARK